MKTSRILLSAVALVSAVALLAGCAAIPAFRASGNAVVQTDEAVNVKTAALTTDAKGGSGGISVSGSASVSLKPDVASFTIGVETMDADAARARAANDTAMKKVYEALKAQGVAEADLQTASYDIYPRYDDKGVTITGYTVSNRVLVKVRDLAKLGDTLGAAGAAGANTAGGISFDISDRTAAYNQALTQAMEKARARAQVIADASGVKLGRVSVINESSSYSGPVYDGGLRGEARDMAVPVSAGQLEVTASISVNFEIAQ